MIVNHNDGILTEYGLSQALLLAVEKKRQAEFLALEHKGDLVGVEKDVNGKTLQMLAEKILLLPQDATSVLFGTYCFGLNDKQIEDVYGVTPVCGRRLYYRELLSRLIGLPGKEYISESSMEKASMKALRRYMSALEKRYRPVYHQTFLLLRSAAAILIAFLTAFMMRMSADAAFRERVLQWIINRFETYSIFNVISTGTTISADKVVFDYMPEGFRQTERIGDENHSTITCLGENGEYIYIHISAIPGSELIDTEDMAMEEITLHEGKAYYYQKDDHSHLVCSYKGLSIHIIGTISKEDSVRIAGSIRE